jgi:mercuric ion transport protein
MKNQQPKDTTTKWLLGAGILAAISATLCCIVPLLLFLLGMSGAWVANLTALEPYRPYFLTAAVIFVGIGFWKIYRKPPESECKPGTLCAMPNYNRVNKIMLWLAVVIIGLVLVYPYIAPMILEQF